MQNARSRPPALEGMQAAQGGLAPGFGRLAASESRALSLRVPHAFPSMEFSLIRCDSFSQVVLSTSLCLSLRGLSVGSPQSLFWYYPKFSILRFSFLVVRQSPSTESFRIMLHLPPYAGGYLP